MIIIKVLYVKRVIILVILVMEILLKIAFHVPRQVCEHFHRIHVLAMPGTMTMEFQYVLHVIIVVTIVKDLVIIIVPNVLLQIIEPILLLQYLLLINAVVMKVIMI